MTAATRGRLLLVDDSHENREILGLSLERSGYSVALAENGAQALSMLDTGVFDMILLDINMPDLSGIDVLRRVRQRHSLAELAVIMVTAQAESPTMVEAFRYGANDYITKPIDFPVDLARIESHLARQAAARPEEPKLEAIVPGTMLGNYTIQKVIGKSGMGVVYEATSDALARKAAIKVMNENVATRPHAARRFRREAQVAARVTHPNVVAIYDAGVWNGHNYIAMELVEGESAQARLNQTGALPWDEATRIIADICRGVVAAHARRVLHRDVKPDNILINREGVPKLTDFGMAKRADEMADDVTQSGLIVGTPRYMSPEQCRGGPQDVYTDIYQLGATYYALLTGDPPYPERTQVFDIMQAHCTAPPPDPGRYLSDLPAACRVIVQTAMQKSPDQRFASATEFLWELEKALQAGPCKPQWETI